MHAQHQSQITFEAYFTGLAFTVLGFAVQTARFTCPLPDALELMSWSLLFGAGLAGLYRGQYMPNVFGVFAQRTRHERAAADLRKQIRDGMQTVEIVAEQRQVAAADLLKNREAMVETATTVSSVLAKKTGHAFALRRFCFVGGMIMLMLSRGFMPLTGIAALLSPPQATAWLSCAKP